MKPKTRVSTPTTTTIMRFTINEEYIREERVFEERDIYAGIPYDKLTHKQLIKIIKGESRVTSISHVDHPEFARLRKMLCEQGYIQMASWWNGDIVTKPFMLNDILFKKKDRFLCAAALRSHMEHAKRQGKTYKPTR